MKHRVRYRNNLYAVYRRYELLFFCALLPIGFGAMYCIYFGWGMVHQASARSYVFHNEGASIEIFEVFDRQQYRLSGPQEAGQMLTNPGALQQSSINPINNTKP